MDRTVFCSKVSGDSQDSEINIQLRLGPIVRSIDRDLKSDKEKTALRQLKINQTICPGGSYVKCVVFCSLPDDKVVE